MTCETCGMWWHDGPQMTIAQLLGSEPITGDEPARDPHVCPEPFPRETAEYLLAFHSQTGVPTTQRIKARIKLGLR